MFQIDEDILIDIIGSMVGGILFIVVTIIALRMVFQKRTKALLFFSLTWLFMAVYFIVESISVLTGNPITYKINYSVFLPLALVLWLVFLDYTQNDEIGWKKMSIAAGMFLSLIIFMWHPESDVVFNDAAYPNYWQWSPSILADWYYVLSNGCILILCTSVFLWTLVTFLKAPKTMRNQTTALFVAGILMLAAAILIFLDVLMIVFIFLLSSTFISTIVITKNPKITHILPYTCYRLIITSKGGTPYFQHNWSEHEINTILLSGLFSAIGSMAKATLEELNVGTIKEVRLQNGVFLTETQYSPVNVGLLASKASVELKNSLAKFAKAFLDKYYTLLYNEDGFPVDIKKDPTEVFLKADMLELIEEHFSNIPSYIKSGISTDKLLEKEAMRAEHGTMDEPSPVPAPSS
ncbi:hypothetical protein GF325_04030 [Candidatus Bathyarchaeota archaeon]|nr:hypothetical protein [Candidatus Bathyarchaeota archaeon]